MNLIDRAIKQIQLDVESGDFTAIEELLRKVPESDLEGFLSDAVDYEDDGQPTELEEWLDFDPDC